MPYRALVQAFDAVAETRQRLVHKDVMRQFFKKVIMLSADDLLSCVYLATGSVCLVVFC